MAYLAELSKQKLDRLDTNTKRAKIQKTAVTSDLSTQDLCNMALDEHEENLAKGTTAAQKDRTQLDQ